MGATASGKTPLAVKLVQHFPCEIISVDSAMIYRGMDIGTAKPDSHTLKIAPHHLINIRDPSEIYSAGQFRQDALSEIENCLSRNNIPLLVGGTMMYFRVLQQGLAELPSADVNIRAELQTRMQKQGLSSLHAWLAQVDEKAAARINPNDSQRIQRALEVYLLTGKNISTWQTENTSPLSHYQVCNLALQVQDRHQLHERIALRFEQMLEQGFVEEVEKLYQRGDLHADLPSIRSVGYRQIWDYLSGLFSYDDMREKAIAATRQLAKRQMTWLRSWPNLHYLNGEEGDVFEQACQQFVSLNIF
jgi:tRNA dimethylallyltransferase